MGYGDRAYAEAGEAVRRLNPQAFGRQVAPTTTKGARGHSGGKFVIPLPPVAKARARVVTNHGVVHSFTPQKTKEYEDALKQWMIISGLQMIPKPTPIKLTVTFYIHQPARSKLDYPTIRPDVDNYTKAIFDAGNSCLWEDDSQIVELHARKAYTHTEGHIELEVKEANRA